MITCESTGDIVSANVIIPYKGNGPALTSSNDFVSAYVISINEPGHISNQHAITQHSIAQQMTPHQLILRPHIDQPSQIRSHLHAYHIKRQTGKRNSYTNQRVIDYVACNQLVHHSYIPQSSNLISKPHSLLSLSLLPEFQPSSEPEETHYRHERRG